LRDLIETISLPVSPDERYFERASMLAMEIADDLAAREPSPVVETFRFEAIFQYGWSCIDRGMRSEATKVFDELETMLPRLAPAEFLAARLALSRMWLACLLERREDALAPAEELRDAFRVFGDANRVGLTSLFETGCYVIMDH